MTPQNISEHIWSYCCGELSPDETAALEARIKREPTLQQEFESGTALHAQLARWQEQTPPQWEPAGLFRGTARPVHRQWLATTIAIAALAFSLIPHVQINAGGIEFRWSSTAVMKSQLESRLVDFDSRQNIRLEQRLAKVQQDQTLKNRQLVVSLLTMAEERRRNDLLQVARWISQQKELSDQQQRQIVRWVANEQQNDKASIGALWQSVSTAKED